MNLTADQEVFGVVALGILSMVCLNFAVAAVLHRLVAYLARRWRLWREGRVAADDELDWPGFHSMRDGDVRWH